MSQPEPREIPAEGYPVTVALDDVRDGPLVLTWGSGAHMSFTVEGGTVQATSRERVGALLSVGGRVTALSQPDDPADASSEQEGTPAGDSDTPPTGSGEQTPRGVDKRSGRTTT